MHTITQDNYHADFYFVDTVLEPQTGRYCGVAYDVKPGAHVLQNSPCTPDNQLFFQLGSSDDPLTVSDQSLSERVQIVAAASAMHTML